MRSLTRLQSDRRGLAAVEAAMLLPVLSLFIGVFFELGYVAFARSTLESATLTAARSAISTNCPSTRAARIRVMIDSKMQMVKSSDGTPTTITIRSYSGGFSDVGVGEPFTDATPFNQKWNVGESYTDVDGSGTYTVDLGREGDLGDAGEVVSYNTSFKVASLMPYIAAQINGGRNYYEVSASTSVRNEPIFSNDGCP